MINGGKTTSRKATTKNKMNTATDMIKGGTGSMTYLCGAHEILLKIRCKECLDDICYENLTFNKSDTRLKWFRIKLRLQTKKSYYGGYDISIELKHVVSGLVSAAVIHCFVLCLVYSLQSHTPVEAEHQPNFNTTDPKLSFYFLNKANNY